MSTEPLRVRVARALHPTATFECRRTHTTTCPYSSKAAAKDNAVADCNCLEDAEDWWMTTRSVDGDWRSSFQRRVPPYGEPTPEGWSCTGPLIERHGIEITFTRGLGRYAEASGIGADGGDVLTAVCELVLVLSDAGKLERAR